SGMTGDGSGRAGSGAAGTSPRSKDWPTRFSKKDLSASFLGCESFCGLAIFFSFNSMTWSNAAPYNARGWIMEVAPSGLRPPKTSKNAPSGKNCNDISRYWILRCVRRGRRCDPLQHGDGVIGAFPRQGCVEFAFGFAPGAAVEGGEAGFAFGLHMHFGQVQ